MREYFYSYKFRDFQEYLGLKGSCRAKEQVSVKKKFSMILRLEIILSVVFCKRKNIIFHLKNLKLT